MKKRVTGVSEAIATSIRLQSDPTNRSVHCSCGCTYLSAAASRDKHGNSICIACGKAAT